MVDWSAGNDAGAKPRKDAIWVGMASRNREGEPVYCRNRTIAFDVLCGLIGEACDRHERVLIAFDFPFGYPRGFAATVTGSDDPLRLWEFFADSLEDTPRSNTRFELAARLNRRLPGVGPFWFNGRKADIPDLPRLGRARHGHGMAERRIVEAKAKGTFSCWQMGGAGAVGGQVMTGIAVLEKLRRRYPGQISVWPLEPLENPVVFVETWPGLISDVVAAEADAIRDRAQVRLMARALARLPHDTLSAMLDVDAPEEGWILGVGHEDELRKALCQI